MSLLTVAQDVAGYIGIPQPTTVNASATANRQLLSVIQRSGEEIARRHDWTTLIRQASFVTVVGAKQAGSLPADFDRFTPWATLWQGQKPVLGPVNAGASAWINAYTAKPFDPLFRVIQGALWLYPDATAGSTITFEYLTKNWIIGLNADADRYANDGDKTYLPERLITLAAIWRWKQTKGFDYAEDMATFEREMERETGRDGGERQIDLGSSSWPTEQTGPYPANGPINGLYAGMLGSGAVDPNAIIGS